MPDFKSFSLTLAQTKYFEAIDGGATIEAVSPMDMVTGTRSIAHEGESYGMAHASVHSPKLFFNRGAWKLYRLEARSASSNLEISTARSACRPRGLSLDP